MKSVLSLLVFFLSLSLWAVEQVPAPGESLGWPREYKKDGHTVVVYQPQIDKWQDYKLLEWNAAVSVQLEGDKQAVFGALYFKTATETNKAAHKVLIKELKVDQVHFPHLEGSQADQFKKIIVDILPKDKTMVVSLERVTAYMEKSSLKARQIKVKYDPPPIFYSQSSASLVIFLGKPTFKKVKDTDLKFAVNTNWDVFEFEKKYYLLHNETWLVSSDLIKGDWQLVKTLPKAFSNLPADENWSETKKQIPAKVGPKPDKIFVVDQPAELILVQGDPKYIPIAGTKLSYIKNTKSELFLHSGEGKHYFLVAGRWFRSKELSGTWEAATLDLPDDFKAIPETHEKAEVLASVPGTDDAEAAMLLSSIPQKARVNRKTTKLTVQYEGDPAFAEITGASSKIYYALNTYKTVIRVGKKYYCCYQAVWFEADSPTGEWVVSIKVPTVIYTIPSTHPAHNVTYVFIYAYDDDYVIVGYTSGYTGSYIADGVVVFGTAYWVDYRYYDDYYHYYYHHCHHYSYGCGAHYDYEKGVYYRGAYAHGPYGGVGRVAAYNPSTGTYGRGAYLYGPNGSAYVKSAYNPSTNRYVAKAEGVNQYGSWGRAVISDGTDWAKAGYKSNWQKAAAGFKTSNGSKGIFAKDKTTGEKGFIVKDKHGDVYVGKDGKIYKNVDGEWQERTKNNWNKVQAQPAKRPSTRPTTQPTRPSTRPTTQPTSRPSTRPSTSDLNRQSQLRRSAIRRTQMYQRARSTSRLRSSGRSSMRRR